MTIKTNKKAPSLSIRTSPSHTKAIPPILIKAISILLILVLGLAFLFSFRLKPKPSSFSENLSPIIDEKIKSLPKHYNEIKETKTYLENKATPHHSLLIENELTSLKEQITLLQHRLEQNNRKHLLEREKEKEEGIEERQAKTSQLFFLNSASFAREEKISLSQDDINSTLGQNIKKQIPHSSKPNHSSSYLIQAGTLIPSKLITAINTSLPGEVIAQTRQNIYDSYSGTHLLIPQGSKIIGQYDSHLPYEQERILIQFYRIIRSDGFSLSLDHAPSIDLQGRAGIPAKIDKHWGRLLGAATLSTLLNLGTSITANKLENKTMLYPNIKQNALLNAINSFSTFEKNIIERSIHIQPTLTLDSGHTFNIIIKKDLALPPYEEK